MKRITVVKMLFGSHLYGTDTPDSDIDYKGVFLPTKDEVLLGQIPKNITTTTGNDRSRNTKDDTDTEMFSLHEFIKLACEGQTIALDMLHAPSAMWTESTMVWADIVDNRDKFYTKNLKAFVGYARKQAAKYGVKGSRLDAAKEVGKFLIQNEQLDADTALSVVWNELPINEYCRFVEDSPNGIRQYEVCGKKLQETMKASYAFLIVRKFHDSYGERARQAANNEGIDWKAVSHAVRAACQVKELLTEYTITFPLKEAAIIKDIKMGKLDYLTEVSPLLEGLIDELNVLSENSTLPDKVDRSYWDNFIKETMLDYVVY